MLWFYSVIIHGLGWVRKILRPLWYRGGMKKFLGALFVASFLLVVAYFTAMFWGPDYAVKMETFLWRIKAEMGVPEAQYKLGNAYHDGKGVPMDRALALKWYQKAADRDFTKAQMNMGYAYYFGEGVTRNYPEAFKYYQMVAEKGDIPSQLMLADSYFLGKNVGKDEVKAIKWYEAAADKGSVKAYLALGYRYRDGWGGQTPDYVQAQTWFKKAADSGDKEAQANLVALQARGLGR